MGRDEHDPLRTLVNIILYARGLYGEPLVYARNTLALRNDLV